MSDKMPTSMSGSQDSGEAEGNKHGGARALADAAAEAQAAGDETQAEALIDQALRTDPEGLADALAQDDDQAALPGDTDTPDDEEVEAISRQIKPHADAPSRSGITGSGSGADDME